jgi:O-Antigen ligase
MRDTSKSIRPSDKYATWLLCLLTGYAVIGKGFAYLGVAPFYIGDITLLIGTLVFLRTGSLAAALATPPSVILGAAMTWVLLCTLPFIDDYGFDALRDSVVIMYGGFAFIVLTLLLEDARRINVILRLYSRFIKIYVPLALVVFLVEQYFYEDIPRFASIDVPVLGLRPGEIAVHLTGAAVFALAGLCTVSRIWVLLLVASLVIVGGMHRGALLAEIVPIALATLILGRLREALLVVAAVLMLFAAAYGLEVTFTDHSEAQLSAERQLSTIQMVANVESIFSDSDQQALEGTKTWRVDWWTIIINDTVYGPHFWSGRGFGLNLADADGFQDRSDPDSPPLRNPHNVQMTILARAGVPGFTLWLLFLTSWLGIIIKAMRTAYRRGQAAWGGLFLFIGCYATSIIIDASFDVALEGPMLGIWFWCLIGFGIGATMIYRVQRHTS